MRHQPQEQAPARPRANLYEDITTRIVAELEAGRVPWVQPWTSTGVGPGMPHNAATGRGYSGINILTLWGSVARHGFSSHGFLTFRQAAALGGSVRRGEHGTSVVYEMLKGIPRMGNKIISSWSISTKPQPRSIWSTAAMIWEASDPYLYIRTSPKGEVICGGEDEEISDADERDAKIAEKTALLSHKLGKLLPMIDATPVHAWAGSFGDSPVGTPTIGRIPGLPNCYAAMGYGGNGITFSMMAAQMLRGQITGAGDPDSDLVSFHRKF